MPDAETLFRRTFGFPPTRVANAPGRLELLGNHTDYNEGLVMSLAVDKYIHMAFSARKDGRIELVSTAFSTPEQFWATDLKKNPDAPWADYVKGVLEQFRKRGIHFSGFNAAIHGDIPMGAGMSSSAALEVATALAVRHMFPYALGESTSAVPPVRDDKGGLPPLTNSDKMAIAKICQAAENQFVGVQSGLLDQISSLFGKAWQVMNIDFRFLRVEHASLAGEAIIICNSGVKHALVGGEYNELRQHCESAAKNLNAKSLRSVELSTLKANQSILSKREYECAFHVVTEIARVAAGERALRDNDHQQFGQYMFLSHESSRDYLKNSIPELDLLVELAKEHPGCLGARLTGGGFGGATINLVSHHQAAGFMKHMADRYEQMAKRRIEPLLCQIVDGAA